LRNAALTGNYETVGAYLATPHPPETLTSLVFDTILAQLTGRKKVAVIKRLVRAGANVNAKDWHGETVLMIAADGGYSKIVELLIRHGANVNTLNNFGQTVLLYITRYHRDHYCRNPKIIELLIQAGANVNARDHRRKTALINISSIPSTVDIPASQLLSFVVYYPDIIESVELLIRAGANVNAKDRDNMTALLYATMTGKSKIVEILIREGAIKETDQGLGFRALRTVSNSDWLDIILNIP
jgi:ankyrin repeat protein